MKLHMLMAATALTLAAAAPAAAQSYAGGTGTFTGIGADQGAFPGTLFDIVAFTALAGTYTGYGTYALNQVDFTVGINRTDNATFSGLFPLVGSFNGTPYGYDVAYSGTIAGSDFITLGGNSIVVSNTKITLNPLTLGGVDGTYSGTLTATVGSVPEQASWAMLIGGVGLVGGTLRRRRAAVRTSLAYA